MRQIICMLVVLTTSLGLATAADDAAAKELKALQGKWKTVSMEVMGKKLPFDFSFVSGPDGKSTGKTAEEEFRFTMSVDPTKKPKTIMVDHETGNQKGMKQYGIYKLEGDTFTVCITPPGKTEVDRPKDFSTKDSNNVIFVFERVKEEKK